MSKKIHSIAIVLTVFSLVFQGLLSGVFGFFSGFLELLFFAGIASMLLFLFSLGKRSWRDSFERSFLTIGSVTGLFLIFVIAFVTISNLFPGKLARITLENGSGNTIVFYQMSHIATEKYYSTIREDIEKEKDAIIYLEGVRPGTKLSHDILDRTLGIRLGSGTYDSIAQMIQMKAQDETLFSSVPEMSHRRVDISVDELVTLMGTGSIRDTAPLEVEDALSLDGLTSVGRWMVALTMRAVMNFSIKNDVSSDILVDAFPEKVREAILDVRNAHLVEAYLGEKPKKSLFLYGALHFDGVYRLLKDHDASWHIKNITPLYPYVR